MTDRHNGRLEGLLLSVVVIAASYLAIGGFWHVTSVTKQTSDSECKMLTESHSDTLAQVVTLALALVALRRLTPGGEDPPK
jgi:hypothetical protein